MSAALLQHAIQVRQRAAVVRPPNARSPSPVSGIWRAVWRARNHLP
jgi:hypothetical protein